MLMSRKTFNKIKAYTLVELIVSMVIISVAFIGMILTFNTAARASGNPVVYFQQIAIAKSYLEEITVKDFPSTLPCPSPPANRSDYTNICDYNNLTNNGVVDQQGNSVSELSNYVVNVNLDTSSASLGSLSAGSDVIRIDVTVNLPGVTQGYTLSAYRTNY